ncbi:hypothetical protein SUGI_0188060 [Cryptomeria japonica]|uniref:G-type lectin S-receptor-like serine/threonine-protein kinase At1g34300 n=1 Tax=Cryptomeria japonica TaxID=3369 RepID=UPI002408E956|nr:G-type lectin S-receptor-like serine/threonine-protein kinase At1g34300 [Cryptomeria japonica]GLJ12284.1 hypothetical protein SUGI_0188060 [Cryptomeria japonica]
MGSPWVLLLVFMVFIWVDGSQTQKQSSTVLSLSSDQLNSSGLKPSDHKYLVSPNGVFCAGFYNLTTNGYAFAVWYANDSERTLAWMANSSSLVGTNSSLILKEGNLSIIDEKGLNVWSQTVSGSELTLENTGNLVFSRWESFRFPTDTLLPKQNFTKVQKLMSRLANGTYGSGNNYYSLSLDEKSNKISLYYMNEQQGLMQKYYWQSEGGFPAINLDDNGFLNTSSVDKSNLIMASDAGEGKRLRRLVLESNGNLRLYSRKMDPYSSWNLVWEAVSEHCTIHGYCGENAVCKVNESWEPECRCPPGFEYNPSDNRSCKAITDIEDPSNVRFVPLDYVDYAGSNVTDRPVTRLQDCKDSCKNENSCKGFAYDLDSGHCVFQYGKLVNGYWSPEAHKRMYLKVSATDEQANKNPFIGLFSVVQNVCPTLIKLAFPRKDSDHTTRDLVIICSLFGAELLCGVLAFWAFLRKYSRFRDIARIFALDLMPSGGPKKFTYAELKAATNSFSDKLGEGGFGPVYRGLLPDQRQIAVKKLEGLQHGEQQFWAEVTIIGRIHHLNLVRMWGFCAEGEHRLLVYEFIPHGSLDRHLFYGDGANVMDWGIRYRIALGVARAIAYLHEECLEWVLHCDIKPENILLDESFCPKVSDFGLAKLVEKERSLSMSTIRGTRGYLAPEWFELNPITAKADVYSFGMVLLEIVSGRRNMVTTNLPSSNMENDDWYFPAWAFEMVVNEKVVGEVVDKRLVGVTENRSQLEAVERMVKTAFWCIQTRPEERPSMGKVAKMLEGSVEVDNPPKPQLMSEVDGDTFSGVQSIKKSAISRY